MREAEGTAEASEVRYLDMFGRGQSALLCVNTQLCPQKCGSRILRRQLSAHLAVCAESPIRCHNSECTQLHPRVDFFTELRLGLSSVYPPLVQDILDTKQQLHTLKADMSTANAREEEVRETLTKATADRAKAEAEAKMATALAAAWETLRQRLTEEVANSARLQERLSAVAAERREMRS